MTHWPQFSVHEETIGPYVYTLLCSVMECNYVVINMQVKLCVSIHFILLVLQLRMAVAEALGFMVHLLSPAALNDQLPKLLPGIMQLYKKHSEHYYITQVGHTVVALCTYILLAP